MRRLSCLLLPLFALLLSCCEKGPQESGMQLITLTLDTGVGMESRAGADGTQTGIADYNENLISWVDFFFYPDGQTEEDAVYHAWFDRQALNLKAGLDHISISVNSDLVNAVLFPTDPVDIRQCTVFAVVNYPGTLVPNESDLSGTSLPDLEQRTVVSNFVTEDHLQERFLMSGSTVLALRGRSQVVAATGEIFLRRYAAKLTVGVNVADEVTTEAGEVWYPLISGMEIYLVNGVKDVTLGGRKETDPTYFSYRGEHSPRFAYIDNDDQTQLYFPKDGDYYQTYPMYTYPQRWVYGSTDSPEIEPYLKLVVPWVRRSGEGISSTQKQYYYKVPIPDDTREAFRRTFTRNNWYHIKVNVSLLGSETDNAMVLIQNGVVFIYDWQDKEVAIKTADISSARYLSVEKRSYELNNIAEGVFRYTSSHPVLMKDIRVTRPYYGTANTGATFGYPSGTVRVAGANDVYPQGTRYLEYGPSVYNGWFEDTGSAIRFNHPLNNDYKSRNAFDYSPYTITYMLVHADRPDDASYRQQQTITQYPGIYIQATPNPDTKTNGQFDHWGYVYVNGGQYLLGNANTPGTYLGDVKGKNDAWKDDHIWRIVHYSSGGTDMYRIDVTVLPEGSDLVIGDPRQAESDLLRPASDFFAQAPYVVQDAEGNYTVGSGTRTLEHYYPTESSDRTVNMVAPIYRISTKLSGIEQGGITLERARQRCAAFQENGFPAGRWRLPTKGEVKFISQLSANGYFEWQFGGDYWSANGAVNVNKNTGVVQDSDPKVAMLRCVYDVWYWGDRQVDNVGQFYWADEARW